MKLYAYCLAEEVESLPDSLRGIAEGRVHIIKDGAFSVVVSDFSAETVPVNRDNALIHAAVVQSVLTQTTPLPFRFGTVVTEPQLRNYVEARREALRAKLESFRGCVEMNVKIIEQRGTQEESPLPQREDKPGTAFLAQKRRELLGSETRVAEAKKIASWIDELTSGFASETRMDTNPSDKLLLATAHLVQRDKVDQYRAKLKEAREERPELHFLVSGPWPPYSFANIDLELKSHFGVS